MGLRIELQTADAVRAADEFAQAIVRVQTAIGQAGRSADEFQRLTNNVARRFGSIGKNAAAATAATNDFSGAVSRVRPVTESAGRSFESLSKKSGFLANRIKAAAAAFVSFQGVRRVVSTLADLEKGFVTLGTVSGATGNELEGLRQIAVDTARASSFTPTETTQALIELSRAGFDAKQSAEALVPATQLAQAGVLSIGKATDIVVQSLAQFRSQQLSAAEAAGVLVSVADGTKSSVESLGSALTALGPTAASFGVTISEAATLAGVLQDTGEQASKSGRAIRVIFQELSKANAGVERSRRAVQALGISFDDLKISSERGIIPVLETLRGALEGLDDSQRVNVLTDLVNTQFAGQFGTLIRDLPRVKELIEDLEDAQEGLASKSEAQNKTLAASIRGIGSAYQEILADTETNDLSSFFRDVADAIRVLGGVDNELVDVSERADTLAKAISGIGWSAAAAGALALGRAIATTPIGAFAAGVGALSVAVEELALSFAGVDRALTKARARFIDYAQAGEDARRAVASLQIELNNARLNFDLDGADEAASRIRSTVLQALKDVQNQADKFDGKEFLSALSTVGAISRTERVFEDDGLEEQLGLVRELANEVAKLNNTRKRFNEEGVTFLADSQQRDNLRSFAEDIEALTGKVITVPTEAEITALRFDIDGDKGIQEATNLIKKELTEAAEIASKRFSLAASGLSRASNLLLQQTALEQQRADEAERAARASAKEKEQRKSSLAALRESVESEKQALKLRQTRSDLENAVGTDREGPLLKQFVEGVTERLRLSKQIEASDLKSLAILREQAAAEANLIVEAQRAVNQAREKAEAEKEVVRQKRQALEAEKAIQKEIQRQQRIDRERFSFANETRIIQESNRIESDGGESNLLTNEVAAEARLAELIAGLRDDGIGQEEAIRLAEERLEAEKQSLRIQLQINEAQKKAAAAPTRDQNRQTRRQERAFIGLQTREETLRLQAFGGRNEERVAQAEGRANAAGLTGEQRDNFLAREAANRDLQNVVERRRQLESSLNSGLQALVSTILDGSGSLSDAFRNAAESIIQQIAQQATQSLSQSLIGGIFGALGSTSSSINTGAATSALPALGGAFSAVNNATAFNPNQRGGLLPAANGGTIPNQKGGLLPSTGAGSSFINNSRSITNNNRSFVPNQKGGILPSNTSFTSSVVNNRGFVPNQKGGVIPSSKSYSNSVVNNRSFVPNQKGGILPSVVNNSFIPNQKGGLLPSGSTKNYNSSVVNNKSFVPNQKGGLLPSNTSFVSSVVNNRGFVPNQKGGVLPSNSTKNYSSSVVNNKSFIPNQKGGLLPSSTSFVSNVVNNRGFIPNQKGNVLPSNSTKNYSTSVVNKSFIPNQKGNVLPSNSTKNYSSSVVNNKSFIPNQKGNVLPSNTSFVSSVVNNRGFIPNQKGNVLPSGSTKNYSSSVVNNKSFIPNQKGNVLPSNTSFVSSVVNNRGFIPNQKGNVLPSNSTKNYSSSVVNNKSFIPNQKGNVLPSNTSFVSNIVNNRSFVPNQKGGLLPKNNGFRPFQKGGVIPMQKGGPIAAANAATSTSLVQNTYISNNSGTVPAQVGQIVTSPTMITRGGRNYSISEGGGSTPEAIMPLVRDNQGRLGVSGTGGGGQVYNIMMPNVSDSRTAREARRNVKDGIRSVVNSVDIKGRGMRPGRNR